ncbi:hypothetical protein [Polaribacter butkevichii]|uniref:Uncharacterized protein n=1 Tax=Polaribacter butkevichii TaxID=218490 RepID=A0A2P6C6G3_9FLAO|nr:hypothetical protein [Polaribacter butkevichii]PQJ68510.1 hypothetical protein BTO14_10575 [Polaribacter butkevichii]
MGLTVFVLFLYTTTAIVAVSFFKKYKLPYFKYFLGYVITVIVFEYIVQLANFYGHATKGIYNIYTFFEYNLVALIYFKLTKETVSHKWIKYLMILFNIIYLFSFIFKRIQDYTVLLGALIVCLFMVFYLKELLKSDRIISFEKSLPFWITIAFLLYYLTSLPFYTWLYVIGIESKKDGITLFKVQRIIIILTHFCFIAGLIWSSKEEN